jgi:hypothetical protein
MIRHIIQDHPYSSMIVAGYIGWLIALYMVSKEQARKDDVPFFLVHLAKDICFVRFHRLPVYP